ncbi:hypothetical protein LV457_09480 [Mycobacterium sp. MYCO198283]|uniref:hypothetical protein n=1 Tax=Mycobacterium sp. MYCO198283 TaxID=2883505 RepID=UPI001E5B03E3|nr:hypothetical protein [Mycobacterium sp. MYCO198283]MCG5432521.1 hypothetical protein [Mycobacterium sp. MYCO198283]
MATLDTLTAAVTSSLRAAVGSPGDLFAGTGPLREAKVAFDADGLPGVELFAAPTRRALVRLSPDAGGSAIRAVCLRFPDLYGPGRHQDLLLASSADGIPFHHFTLPASRPDERLYSSLWLYLAGLAPVVFGMRAPRSADGDWEFLLASAVSRFRPIGTVSLGGPADGAPDVRFAARNTGGGLRALPPVRSYSG